MNRMWNKEEIIKIAEEHGGGTAVQHYYETGGATSGTMTADKYTELANDNLSFILHNTGDVLLKVQQNSNFIMYSNVKNGDNTNIRTFKVMASDKTWTLSSTTGKVINSFGNGLTYNSDDHGLGIDYDYIQRPLIAGDQISVASDTGYITCTAQKIIQADLEGTSGQIIVGSELYNTIADRARYVVLRLVTGTMEYLPLHYEKQVNYQGTFAVEFSYVIYSTTFVDSNNKVHTYSVQVNHNGSWALTHIEKVLATMQTTAPTSAITDGGVHIVSLSEEPATKYSGYIYLIAEEE